MTFIIHIALYTLCILIFNFQGLSHAASHLDTTAWVIRWDIDSPSEIKDICREAKDNFDHLLVQVRGRADSYYESDIAPRSEDLKKQPADFDPLATVLDQCSSHSIQAWLNVFYLWTGETLPEDPLHPAQQENNWILQDNNDRSVSEYSPLELAQGWIEGIYADPSSPAYRSYFLTIVQELIEKYNIMGIHLDFIRYPGLSYGYGTDLSQRYMEQWGFDPGWLPDTLSHNDIMSWIDGTMKKEDQILTTGTMIWAAMRAAEVTEMVRGLRNTLNKKDRNIILSAAIFPDMLSAFITKGQDWHGWSGEGLVDQLYPMAYFGEKERVSRQLWNVASVIDKTGISIHAGLGAYIKNSEDIKEESHSISGLPFDGISLFSLGHLLNKKDRSKPYIQALSEFKQPAQAISFSSPSSNISRDQTEETEIISALRSLNGSSNNSDEKYQHIIWTRKKEFIEASRTFIPKSIQIIKGNNSISLPWVDLRGIFRFVHIYDSLEKSVTQRENCEKAREMIVKGKNPVTVAKQHSQTGSRQFGAQLPRHYLSPDKNLDNILGKLKVGEISEVIKQDDGFWAYQLMEKGINKPSSFSAIPWPGRRLLLRLELARTLTNKK